jgi:MoaA/NifB/PqqE/SkfB family radical SAM enzyme
VHWDLTNTCNLSCLHCYASSGLPAPGELTDDEALAFARQLVEDAVAGVTIGGGEPLIRPVVLPIMEALAAGAVPTSVVTNGTLVDARMARRLASLGLRQVTVSVDAASEPVHDLVRQRAGSFVGAVRALRLLRAAGARTGLNMVLTATNVDQVPDVIELAIRLECESVLLLKFVPAGRGHRHAATLEPTDEAFHQLGTTLAAHAGRWGSELRVGTTEPRLVPALPPAVDPAVSRGRGAVRVDARGGAYGPLPVCLGSVRKLPLRELWRRAA